MAKYLKTYSFKGKYKIKERSDGDGFDVFNIEWDPYEPDFENLPSIEDAKQWILNNIAMDEQKKVKAKESVSEYAKKFKMLSEYSFWGGPLTEEDPAEPPADDPNAAAPPADPNADPNAMPPDGGEFEDIDIDDGGEDAMQPDDNVIDVSAITGAQEQTNAELQQLSDRFEQLLQLNDKVTQTLDMLAQSAEENRKEVQSVKDDLALRVPTETELRSLNNSGSIWIRYNDVNGRLFGTAPNQIFLPAGGYSIIGSGHFFADTKGLYWSRNGVTNYTDGQDGRSARSLSFCSFNYEREENRIRWHTRTFASNVRCVDKYTITSISFRGRMIDTPLRLNVGTRDIAVVPILNLDFFPSDAPNRNVTWSSSNPSVVSVNAYGRITVISAGTTIITATTEVDARTATITIVVSN
jgi:hypothetical protein